MRWFTFLSLVHSFTLIRTQKNGDSTPETAPKIAVQQCTKGSCSPIEGVATIDANWRWTYDSSKQNCYKGNLWAEGACPTGEKCAENCFLDGANYKDTYGVESTGDALKLSFVTNGPYSKNIGSRLYFLVKDKYFMFKLKNKEFSFTVDVSQLPCGLNGALYFAGMDEDGGMSKYPANKVGATKGTGYCDAQCPQDVKWIGGKANSEGWVPSKTDPNSGTGNLGTCCPEMDIWEANSVAQAFTPHTCTTTEPTICQKDKCGNSKEGRYKAICDKDGCDFASYRWGAKEFYGPSKTVDSTKKFTVITQFVTADGTDKGALSEIKRFYVQDGKVIHNEAVKLPGSNKPFESITQEFCDATKKATNDVNDFKAKGGMKGMDAALEKGMVLVFSLWDDQAAHMNWLDSDYPPTKTPKDFGVSRGTCKVTEGNPDLVRTSAPKATVEFSDVKFGDIGSTFKDTGAAGEAKGKSPRRKCR